MPQIHSHKKSKPTDFSYLFPFISSDNWAQISARVANFGNKPTQLALVCILNYRTWMQFRTKMLPDLAKISKDRMQQ